MKKKEKTTNQVMMDHQYQKVGTDAHPFSNHLSNTVLNEALRILSGVRTYMGPGHDLMWKARRREMVWIWVTKAQCNQRKRMSRLRLHQAPDHPS
jgi:hypothetical protein